MKPELPINTLNSEALAGRLDRLVSQLDTWRKGGHERGEILSVWGRVRRTSARVLHSAGVAAPPPVEAVDVVVCARRGDRVGEAKLTTFDHASWVRAVDEALDVATVRSCAPVSLALERTPPLTFDPELLERMEGGRTLDRIAWGLTDNTWHETSRLDGLDSLSGHVAYRSECVVIVGAKHCLTSIHGELTARIELNEIYGDVSRQLHAPESFKPMALLGARTWRTMPRGEMATLPTASEHTPVVLHPRLFERLLRFVVPTYLTGEALRSGRLRHEAGDQVASSGLTIVNDPTLDGLYTSRAFDDQGAPTRRSLLIARGRLAQVLRTSEEARLVGTISSGSSWRGPDSVPNLGLGSLLVERGDTGFHEMVERVPFSLLVHELDDLVVDATTGHFTGVVRWGVTLSRSAESQLVGRGRWRLSGHLFDTPTGERGALRQVALSREIYDTGTGYLPYALCPLSIEAVEVVR